MTKKIKPQEGKLGSDPLAGLDNTKIDEKQPIYATAESEKEIAGGNNARIILGRDRNHNITSGYGGSGHTRCGAIDLVVGLQPDNPNRSIVVHGLESRLTGGCFRLLPVSRFHNQHK